MWGPVWFGSSEIPLLACRLLTSHCIFMWQKEGKRDFWGSFHKVINFIHEGSTHSWTNCLPKALPPNTIALGIRISTYVLERDTNIYTIVVISEVIRWVTKFFHSFMQVLFSGLVIGKIARNKTKSGCHICCEEKCNTRKIIENAMVGQVSCIRWPREEDRMWWNETWEWRRSGERAGRGNNCIKTSRWKHFWCV